MLGAPITVTPPAAELIPIESARSYLRIDGSALDAEIGMLAAAAVEDLEDRTGLRLLNQTVTVTADCFDDLALFRVGPIRALPSIAYRDAAGADQILAAASYELFGAPLQQGARPVDSWPVAESGSIIVTLDVGYGAASDDVPAKIRFAAYAILRGKFEGTETDVDSLIANYRFWL